MDAIDCLKTRRSVRRFKADEVDKSLIEDIIDCGRLAATAMNLQPWQFVVVTNSEMLRRIAETTDHGKFIANAPVCIAVFCEKCKYFIEDGSAATQNILLAARAHGLGSCWIAGDKKPYCPQIAEMLGVPDTHTLISLIAIGHTDSTGAVGKKPLGDVLHWEKY